MNEAEKSVVDWKTCCLFLLLSLNVFLGKHGGKACLSEAGNPYFPCMSFSRQERNQTELQGGLWWARYNLLEVKLLLSWQ